MEKATLPQASQILKLVNDQDPNDKQVQDFIESGIISGYFEARKRGKEITPQIVREFFGEVSSVYKIVIDYNLSLAEMIKAGKYDWINDDIVAKNFPIQIQAQGNEKQNLEITLLHFNRYISSDDAIKETDKAGYRPANLPELLALGTSQPEFQGQFPIVALGSVWQRRDGNRYVPDLWDDGSKRYLSLDSLEYAWFPNFRFAVARK